MPRRSRNNRARHLAWSETRQETDVVAAVQSTDKDENDGPRAVRISSLDLEVDYLTGIQTVPRVRAVPTISPVLGESFCQCEQQEEIGPGFGITNDCLCGEEEQVFDWVWDEQCRSSGAMLSCDDRKVNFHSDHSCGTAAIRGTRELCDGQHYWEVKMTSPVYGTDMMVGIGTSEVNLKNFKFRFVSLLGQGEDSWGLSYTGLLQHKGEKVKFSSRFGQGSIIGMHLDTWHGTLTFYKNRHRIGVAATRLQNKKFYPIVCSTAAKSSMKLVRACYAPTSLQYLCCASLRQTNPCCPDVIGALGLPPGLRTFLQSQLGWVFTLNGSSSENIEEDYPEETTQPTSAGFFTETAPYRCPCGVSTQDPTAVCRCSPTPPSSDYDSCCSEPEDHQCKKSRWT